MESQNNGLGQRLLISCGVMALVAVVCITGFIIASSIYLFLASN